MLVIGGREESVPGLAVQSYRAQPDLKLEPGKNMRNRNTRWVRNLCLHTTKGKPVVVAAGAGPSTGLGRKIATMWRTEDRKAGAHLSIDWDGTVACHADLLEDAAYHAGVFNEVSIGIELYQGSGGELYQGQLAATVKLVDWLSVRFAIQRQMPAPSVEGVISRAAAGGKDLVGVFGHRHITTDRGPGDPGDPIFVALQEAGWAARDFSSGEDRAFWKDLQRRELGFGDEAADGIPGPHTADALRDRGYQDGLWRPA